MIQSRILLVGLVIVLAQMSYGGEKVTCTIVDGKLSYGASPDVTVLVNSYTSSFGAAGLLVADINYDFHPQTPASCAKFYLKEVEKLCKKGLSMDKVPSTAKLYFDSQFKIKKPTGEVSQTCHKECSTNTLDCNW